MIHNSGIPPASRSVAAIALLSIAAALPTLAYAQKVPAPAPQVAPAARVKPVSDIERVESILRAGRGYVRPNAQQVIQRHQKYQKKLGTVAGDDKGQATTFTTLQRPRLGAVDAMLHYLKQRADKDGNLNPDQLPEAIEQRRRMRTLKSIGNPGLGGAQQGRAAAPVGVTALPPVASFWQELGPTNARPEEGGGQGPVNSFYTGRANRVVFDAKIRKVAYLTSPSGGIWKSIDSGQTWNPIGDQLQSLKTTAISAAAGIVYVGMGDYEYPGASLYSQGLMRSTNGGASFQQTGSPAMARASVSGIAINPDHPTDVVVSTGRRTNPLNNNSNLYRTSNGGTTWSAVNFISGGSALADWANVKVGLPNRQNVRPFFAIGMVPNGSRLRPQIAVTRDRGLTWAALNVPTTVTDRAFSNSLASDGRVDIAPSATDSNVLYLFAAQDSIQDTQTGAILRPAFLRLYRGTLNSGGTGFAWQDLGTMPSTATNNGVFGQSFYDVHVGVAPYPIRNGRVTVMRDAVYTGTLGLSACLMNAANTAGAWTDISQTYSGSDTFHTDQHGIAYNPFEPEKLLVANDGGVYGMTFSNKFSPGSWAVSGGLNASVRTIEYYFADFHQTNPNIMLGGTQDNSTPAMLGTPGKWRNVGVGDGGGTAIGRVNQNHQYSSSQFFGTLLTTSSQWGIGVGNPDAPRQFDANISPSLLANTVKFYDQQYAFVGQIVADPAQNALYIASDYLWRFNFVTNLWESDLGGASLGKFTLEAVTFAPSDPLRIFVGSGSGEISTSPDRGATWTRINWLGDPVPATSPPNTNFVRGLYVRAIDVHPTNPNDILVTVSGSSTTTPYVYRSTNALSAAPTFTSIQGAAGPGQLPFISVNSIARSPNNPNSSFWAGTDMGVFFTDDGGATWQDATVSLGLPNVQVNIVKANAAQNCINIATYGRGMWRLPLR